MEIEAKFIIRRPEQVDQVLATLDDLGYEITEGGTDTHIDTYFDTPDRSIMHAGWTYRCRQHGDSGVLTLKSLGTVQGAVFVREEIEQQLPDGLFRAHGRLPPGIVQEQLEKILGGERPHKLFTVRSRRTVFSVVAPGDTAAFLELDLDQCRIRAKKAAKRAPGRLDFTELELELESGDGRAVNTLAQVLRDKIGLVPAQFSKFHRGLYVAGITADNASRQQSRQRLKGKDPLIGLLYLHLRHQLDEIKRYQPVAWEGFDPEGVHKMRVATRRIRAALKTFSDILAADVDNNLEIELCWLAGQLGKARDADVCEMEISRFDVALPADAAAPYRDHLRQSTVAAYTNLTDVLASSRYSRLVAKLEQLFATGPGNATEKAFGKFSISAGADQYVKTTERKMLKRGEHISLDSPAERLHKLRIAAKRLRYLLDFFSVAQRKKWRTRIAALERLQELLGEHQDAVTARERHWDYARSVQIENVNAELLLWIGRLMQKEDKRIARCRRRFPAEWSRLKKAIG